MCECKQENRNKISNKKKVKLKNVNIYGSYEFAKTFFLFVYCDDVMNKLLVLFYQL